MRLGMLAASGAAGAMLLAAFVAFSQNFVAMWALLAVAGVLMVLAAMSLLRVRARARGTAGGPRRAGAAPLRRGPLPPRPAPGRPPPPAAPGDRPATRTVDERPAPGAGVRAAPAPAGLGPTGPGVAAVARDLAQQAVQRISAPASSVLVRRGDRLVAAGTAGDWALARQLQAETREDEPGWPAYASPTAGTDDADPPSFPVDEMFTEALAQFGRPAPLERWQELEDAPPEVLPVAGLSERGVGVAVPIVEGRSLAGLWVLARRPKGRAYTDAELVMLDRLSRQIAPRLGAALAGEAPAAEA
jgi:hypothetical protein